MVEIPTRRRPLALLAIVVVAQVLLLAFQVRHGGAARDKNVPLIRYWAAEMIMPFERAGSWMFSGAGGFWSGYIDLRHERKENIDLRAENGELKLRNHQLETEVEEARRMDAILEFRHDHPEAPMVAAEVVASTPAMVAARVIGGSADPVSHTIFINRGAHDGIRRDMAVITPDGIVGKIVEVFPHASQVLLISDRESGVGAMLAASHAHGIVKGTGDPDPQMDYVENDEKVQAGDEIVTSGDDRIFPKGLAVGVVADDRAATPFQVIHIRTAAHLDRLEDVLVLLTERDLNLKTAVEASPVGAQTETSKPTSTGAAQHQAAPAAKVSKSGAAASPKAATPKPDIQKPATQKPASSTPATAKPAVPTPTTAKPTSSAPATAKPATVKPATPTPATSKPETPKTPNSQPAAMNN